LWPPASLTRRVPPRHTPALASIGSVGEKTCSSIAADAVTTLNVEPGS
jgi:hypothetical protein